MAFSSNLKEKAGDITGKIGSEASYLTGQARDRVTDLVAGQRKNAGWFAATLIAFGVGLVIGILTAPRSGHETRERIEKQAKSVKNQMRHIS